MTPGTVVHRSKVDVHPAFSPLPSVAMAKRSGRYQWGDIVERDDLPFFGGVSMVDHEGFPAPAATTHRARDGPSSLLPSLEPFFHLFRTAAWLDKIAREGGFNFRDFGLGVSTFHGIDNATIQVILKN